MNPAIGVALALLAPGTLEALSLNDAIEKEKQLRPDWAASLPGGILPAKMLKNYAENARRQTTVLRKAIFIGIWQGLAPVLVGVAAGMIFAVLLGPPPKVAVYTLQVLGAATIMAGTTTKAGQEIETFDGNTLPERLNAQLLPGLSMIGTTILVLGYVWDLG